MDSKNVIAAISLSAAVIILYSLFFAPSPQELNKINKDNVKNELSSETPMLEENNKLTEVSRIDALNLNTKNFPIDDCIITSIYILRKL